MTVTMPQFAAGMNGALFVDLLFACLMFFIYVVHEVRQRGYRNRAQAATAIMVMLSGEAVLRGWFWLWRFEVLKGASIAWMNNYPVVPIGMALQMLGVLCLIRVFSPDSWSKMTWLAVGVAGIVIAVVVANS